MVSRYGIEGGPRFEIHLVLAGHLLEHDLQVQLADAADHGFVGLRVVLEAETGILGHQLVQHVGHFLFVAALLRLHRQPEHGDRQLERPGVDVRLVRGVVQDVIEADFVDLGDGADVPRHRLVDFDLRLAPEHVEVSGLDGLAALADEELGPGVMRPWCTRNTARRPM
jgi:hypothetical protein